MIKEKALNPKMQSQNTESDLNEKQWEIMRKKTIHDMARQFENESDKHI